MPVSIPARWRPWWRRWAGLVATFLVLEIMLVAVTLRQGHEVIPGATLLIFTVLSWVPLLFRFRAPVRVLVATVTVESMALIFVPFIEPSLNTPVAVAAYQPVPLATMTAAWTLASRRPPLIGWIGGVGAASTLLLVSLLARPATLIGTDMVMFNLVCIATGAGVFVAARARKAQRMKRSQEQQTRDKVMAERLRIARELHDVLAHRLTLVNAQAGIANYLLDTDPQAAAAALVGITDHTRSALDELRATVGLLRQSDDPPGSTPSDAADSRQPVPTLDHLDALVAGFRAAGITVAVDVAGQPRPLAASADLAAYRIIQESLTNAMKHAPGAPVSLAMHWRNDEMHLRIENDPSTEPLDVIADSGSGNGLIGMRERIQVCGGELAVGQTSAGGYLVEAHIPTKPSEPARPDLHLHPELS